MDPDLVLSKTAKGREEIEKRTHRVDARRRTLLILVDGRSSVATLAEKTAHMADALPMLQSLLAEGFVEAAGDSGAAAVGGGAGPSLEELKRTACQAIGKMMGPDGDSVALRLERATTRQEFLAEAQRAREILRSFLGPKQAEGFWKALGQ